LIEGFQVHVEVYVAPEPEAERDTQLGILFPLIRNCVVPGTFMVKVIVVLVDFMGDIENETPFNVGEAVIK
jgi:hypothetical protein